MLSQLPLGWFESRDSAQLRHTRPITVPADIYTYIQTCTASSQRDIMCACVCVCVSLGNFHIPKHLFSLNNLNADSPSRHKQFAFASIITINTDELGKFNNISLHFIATRFLWTYFLTYRFEHLRLFLSHLFLVSGVFRVKHVHFRRKTKLSTFLSQYFHAILLASLNTVLGIVKMSVSTPFMMEYNILLGIFIKDHATILQNMHVIFFKKKQQQPRSIDFYPQWKESSHNVVSIDQLWVNYLWVNMYMRKSVDLHNIL